MCLLVDDTITKDLGCELVTHLGITNSGFCFFFNVKMNHFDADLMHEVRLLRRKTRKKDTVCRSH